MVFVKSSRPFFGLACEVHTLPAHATGPNKRRLRKSMRRWVGLRVQSVGFKLQGLGFFKVSAKVLWAKYGFLA